MYYRSLKLLVCMYVMDLAFRAIGNTAQGKTSFSGKWMVSEVPKRSGALFKIPWANGKMKIFKITKNRSNWVVRFFHSNSCFFPHLKNKERDWEAGASSTLSVTMWCYCPHIYYLRWWPTEGLLQRETTESSHSSISHWASTIHLLCTVLTLMQIKFSIHGFLK